MNLQVQKQNRFLQRKRRARAKFHGTSECPRLSVYRSLRFVYAQLIDDTTGTTLVAVTDRPAFGKGSGKSSDKGADKSSDKDSGKSAVTGITGNTPLERALSVGKQLAIQAKTKGITTAVFDRGGRKYHGRVKAVADGAREGGLTF